MSATLSAFRAYVTPPAASVWLRQAVEAERGRFMPWLAVTMIAGDLGYFALLREPAAYAGPALLGVAVALSVLLRSQASARMAAFALLAAATGFASAQWAASRAPPSLALPRTAVVFTATVAAIEPRPDGRRLTVVDAHWEGATLRRALHIRLRLDDSASLATGDTVQLRAVLRPPAPPAYPGGWDLQRDAFFSGLGGGGVALGPVAILSHPPPAGPAHWLTALREAIASRLLAGLPGVEGALAATLLTGEGSAIPPADRAAFRDSGLAHLLAVAGLHIGIVMGLVMGGARLALAASEHAALRWPCKQIAASAALLAGAGYVLITGMHVPVLRSFAMACLVTLGIATGRRAFSLRGLALAAMVLVLASPEEVVGVSFQMSFAAVLALIAGYEALRPALARLYRKRAIYYLATLSLTSLLAGAASAPFGAYHFGQVQLYFVLANLAAVPLTAMAAMPAGLLALALMPLGLERLALTPMGWALDAVLWIARTVSALPAATLGVPHMPGAGLLLIALGLAWLGLWRSRLRLAGAPVLAAGLLSGLVSPPADLLVSPDARLIALRSPAYLQSRPGAPRFVQDSWIQYWAEPLAAPFPESGEPGPVRCDADGCRIIQSGTAVLLARSLHPMDCTGAALLISAEPARAVCPALPHIDRFTVWRDGAQAVWLRNGQAYVLSDRANRGERPWVPPPTAAPAQSTNQPMALAE